ncbi:MAG: ribonuclease III [Coriobacteriia bacterium]
MDASARIERAEAALGHVFGDRSLVESALTHPSYTAEVPGSPSYERLEFLGDSVLGLVVAERLYRAYPGAAEGILTRRKIAAVSGDRLALVAGELGLADLVSFGRGEARSGDRGRASLLENVFEALIGAVYLDAGLDAARDVVSRLLSSVLDLEDIAAEDDPKSRLQEYTQARGAGLPEYRVAHSSGPPHAPEFKVEVLLGGRIMGAGTGRSKKEAEKAAASAALEAVDAG